LKLWERAESVPSGRWQPAFDEVKLMKRNRAVLEICFLLSLAWPTASAWAANSGHIVSLDLIGASGPGDCIEISSQVQADEPLPPSNLYYELFAPGGSRIAIRQINLPSLGTGETSSDSWDYCNPPSTGTYRVTLCWSTGVGDGTGKGNTNGNISCGDTQGYSVPTLGSGLSLVALLLLAVFLLQHRREFAKVSG
jgi:hypothetical protein